MSLIKGTAPAGFEAQSARAQRRIDAHLRFANDLSVLSESLGENEFVDDDALASVLREATEDHGIRKEWIADRLGLNAATIYRWLKKQNMPLGFSRQIILKLVRDGLLSRADEAVEELLYPARTPDDEETKLHDFKLEGLVQITRSAAANDRPAIVPKQPFRWLTPVSDLLSNAPPTNDHRPTFAAFRWSGRLADGVDLTPASCIREACLIVRTPGVSYFDPVLDKYVPIEIDRGQAILTFFFSTGDEPWLPSIRLRCDRNSEANALSSGILLLSSEAGVPFDLVNRGVELVPADPPGSGSASRQLLIKHVPIAAHAASHDWIGSLAPLSSIEQEHYEHRKAIEAKNFEVFHIPDLHKILSERRKSKFRECSLMCRILRMERDALHQRDEETVLVRHQGFEIFLPVSGAINAHLGAQRDLLMAEAVGDDTDHVKRSALAKSHLVENPVVLRAGQSRAANEHAAAFGDVLYLNPNDVFHGFTPFSHQAAAIGLAVVKVDYKKDWIGLCARNQGGATVRNQIA